MLFFSYLASPKFNREVDELGIFANEILNGVLFQEIRCFLFKVEADLTSTKKSVSTRILNDTEAVCIRLPNVLHVIIVL